MVRCPGNHHFIVVANILWNTIERMSSDQTTSCNLSPTEEFKFTANSLGAHIETHGKLILRTLSYLTVNSHAQDDSHCELAVSFP